MSVIDLNADLGESFGRWQLGDDAALLDIVTSANIACGFHAGDPATILTTVRRAAERGVAIGAHVSYPDLVGFGRRYLDMSAKELTAAVLYQIGALAGLARSAGTRVRYVKPHGALYNRIVTDEAQAGAVARAVTMYDATLPILSLPGSALYRLATEAGLPTVTEAFPDRGYRADGSLLPRSEPGAVLHDPDLIADRAVQIATEGTVQSTAGELVAVPARSICIHGDTPSAVDSARAVREALTAAGVNLAAFTGPAD